MTRKHFVLAMASSPHVPLDEINHVWNLHEILAICHCEQSEAINRHRIPMILASHTFGCHARPMGSLAMTKIDVKILEVRL